MRNDEVKNTFAEDFSANSWLFAEKYLYLPQKSLCICINEKIGIILFTTKLLF